MSAQSYAERGHSLLAQRQFAPAFEAYAIALSLQPDNPHLRFLCGEALFHLERYADVVACLQDLDTGKDTNLALEHAMTLGLAQQRLGLSTQAELNLLKAYMLRPDSEEAACNLASLYDALHQHALALPFLEPALQHHPHSERLHYLLGCALLQCGRRSEGQAALRRCLELAPGHRQAHQNLALAALLDGDLPTGWTHYAWRSNRDAALGAAVPALAADLAGQTVQVVGEQGIGDELFFMRYLPLLQARGARIQYRVCNAKLQPLLAHLEIQDLDHAGAAATTLWAGDLPQALGDYGYPPPLRFRQDKLPRAAWQARMGGRRRRLGLTWRAGTAATRQTGPHQWLSKAVPLDALLDVLAPLPVDVVVLQRQPLAEELEGIVQRLGQDRVLDASAHDSDLVDLLALLSQLDGLVGVSNTNVHLAAGLGLALHTLVPCPYEFRWGAEGASSPWFPGSAVYRQSGDGDWSAALAQLQAL